MAKARAFLKSRKVPISMFQLLPNSEAFWPVVSPPHPPCGHPPQIRSSDLGRAGVGQDLAKNMESSSTCGYDKNSCTLGRPRSKGLIITLLAMRNETLLLTIVWHITFPCQRLIRMSPFPVRREKNAPRMIRTRMKRFASHLFGSHDL
jgi:hypothetical protein